MFTRADREAAYDAETGRMLKVLLSFIEQKSPSIRFLEKKMGVADALFNKILKGKVTLQFRHILMIADAIEVPWQDIFGQAYGFTSALTQPISPELRSSVLTILMELGLIDPAELQRKTKRSTKSKATRSSTTD